MRAAEPALRQDAGRDPGGHAVEPQDPGTAPEHVDERWQPSKVSRTITGHVAMVQSVPAAEPQSRTTGPTNAAWPPMIDAPSMTIERITRLPATPVPTGVNVALAPDLGHDLGQGRRDEVGHAQRPPRPIRSGCHVRTPVQ